MKIGFFILIRRACYLSVVKVHKGLVANEPQSDLQGSYREVWADRLIFATDYPEGNLKTYCDILDQMDFTVEEMEQIAYKNIIKILKRK